MDVPLKMKAQMTRKKTKKINMDETIYNLALKVRKVFEDYFTTDKSLLGLCLDASIHLKWLLARNGIKSTIVHGTFKNDDIATPEFNHYWIKVNGYILDITATQFNPFLSTKVHPYPSVYFAKSDERYVEIDPDYKNMFESDPPLKDYLTN